MLFTFCASTMKVYPCYCVTVLLCEHVEYMKRAGSFVPARWMYGNLQLLDILHLRCIAGLGIGLLVGITDGDDIQ